MKTLLSILLLTCLALAAQAQTATDLTLRCVVRFDDGTAQTNVLNVSDVRLKGLVAAHAENTKTRLSGGTNALTLGQFAVQEVRDKGIEWQRKGALASIKLAGWTNTAVQPSDKLLARWDALSAGDQARVVDYLNRLGE
mgnify:FL=1